MVRHMYRGLYHRRMSVDEYRENLVNRHGKKFLEDLDEVFNGKTKLAQIGRDYGLSRMRISHIFQRVYNKRLKDVKAEGYAEDSSGFVFDYGNTKNKSFSVTIPEWLYKKLRKKSKFLGTPMNQLIREALDKSFKRETEEEKYKLYR